MTVFTWLNSRVKRFRWYDISLTKLSTAAFVLLIAKLWPPLLNLPWEAYAIIGTLAAVSPVVCLFGTKHYHCKECMSNPCECGEHGPQVRM